MRQRSVLPSIAAVLILALAGVIAVPAVPARADPPRHDDRDHHYRRPPPRHYYRPVVPAPVYAPPTVVYQPAPVSPGINLVIPFNIR